MSRFSHPIDFAPVQNALERYQAAGGTLRFWWRDDDATRPTPALDRLLALSEGVGVPVALAVIPARAEPALRQRIDAAPGIDLLVHGLAHADHAPAGQKKAEFGAHRPQETLLDDARAGLNRLASLTDGATLPVFVPPWNRIAPDLVPLLAGIGYRGLSVFGPLDPARYVSGLVRVNTHVDPIAWKAGGSLLDPREIVAKVATLIDQRLETGHEQAEPLGLLTHHLVHDEAIWSFVTALLEALARSPAAKPARAAELFAGASA